MSVNSHLIVSIAYIVLSLFLVALNGFFVAAEFAIVKVRRTRLEELVGQGVSAARISILCVDQMDEYLSATQLGITLVSLALGWVGEHAFYDLLILTIDAPGWMTDTTFHAVSLGLSFFTITLLHVVLGELVPKSMAIQRAEQITLFISPPLRLFYKIASPLINVFTALANFVLRLLGFHGLEELPLTEEELKMVMNESREDGVISESEAQIINRAFSFSDKVAKDIMIPASQVQYISLKRSLQENLEVTRKRMYTRFPLTIDGLDSVIGMVHMKDALQALAEVESNTAFEQIARPAVFVSPDMRIDKIMRIFREKRSHLAVVQDPVSRQNLGVVALEDILEELVGDIVDEHGN
jgi:CBS domain containing-hemolysin-like protein